MLLVDWETLVRWCALWTKSNDGATYIRPGFVTCLGPIRYSSQRSWEIIHPVHSNSRFTKKSRALSLSLRVEAWCWWHLMIRCDTAISNMQLDMCRPFVCSIKYTYLLSSSCKMTHCGCWFCLDYEVWTLSLLLEAWYHTADQNTRRRANYARKEREASVNCSRKKVRLRATSV